MKRNRDFDLIYESAIRRFADQIYDSFKDIEKLAEFAVYCREKFKDELVMRLLMKSKRILDKYEKSLRRIRKNTSIPMLFVIGDSSVSIPVHSLEEEMEHWIAIVRENARKERKDIIRSIVYSIALSEQLSTTARFVNTLWNISSLKSDLDKQDFILLEGFDGILVRNSYNLPADCRRKRKYLVLIKHFSRILYGVPLREHDFFVQARILTKRYDSLFLLTDEIAQNVALKMALK